MYLKITQVGDTMVEVLIAMVIIGVILAGGFVTVNHSLINERQAQERGEALQLIQTQIERIRGVVSNSDVGSLPPAGTQFCMSSNLMWKTASPGHCQVDASETLSMAEPSYLLTDVESMGANGNVFTATATWDEAGTGTRINISLEYRMY